MTLVTIWLLVGAGIFLGVSGSLMAMVLLAIFVGGGAEDATKGKGDTSDLDGVSELHFGEFRQIYESGWVQSRRTLRASEN